VEGEFYEQVVLWHAIDGNVAAGDAHDAELAARVPRDAAAAPRSSRVEALIEQHEVEMAQHEALLHPLWEECQEMQVTCQLTAFPEPRGRRQFVEFPGWQAH